MVLLSLATGLGFLSLAVWKLSSPETDPTTLLTSAGLGLGALFHFGMSLTRFQVVEGGLWYFGDLLRWEDIRVYRWTLDSTLWVEFNRRPGLLGPYRAAIEVPPELRGEIDAILVGLNVPRGAEVGGEAPLPGGREQPPRPTTGSSLTAPRSRARSEVRNG